MHIIELYLKIISNLRKHLSNRQFLIISSIFVGLTAGIAAVALKTIVHYIQSLLTYDFNFRYNDYLYLVFPGIGIILTVTCVNYLLKNKFGRGAAHILYYMSKKMSLLERVTMYSHILTSALTVGFGGSAGLEAPIVVTGAAIGSNYGRVNMFDYRDRTLLLACGSAAGIASIFDAPIAGVMFALEVLISEAAMPAFIPLIIASATGALCSKIILQQNILLSFALTQPFNYHNVIYYIIMGVMAGFVSLYYAKVFGFIEALFKPLAARNYAKAVSAALILALLVFLLPPLFGEGYESIKFLASGHTEKLLQNSIFSAYAGNEWFVLMFIGAVMLVKAVATSVTLGGGGNGGSFAPSLFVGAFMGFFFSRLLNLAGISILPEANFTLVGMAGILSGVMYAPLTGIFLIAEITGGYELMIPLMLVSSISYIIVKHFEPYSMDTKELALKGELIRGNRDKAILSLLHMQDIIETNFQTVPGTATMTELTALISHSKRNLFPVVDSNNNLIGIITLESIREILFELDSFKDMPAIELMSKPVAVIQTGEEMDSIMAKFDSTGAWNLPVTDKGRYAGFISKSSIFAEYRTRLLTDFTDE